MSHHTTARNVNTVDQYQATTVVTDLTTHAVVTSVLGNGNVGWTVDVRPESAHAPFIWTGSSFRQCTPWDHHGERVTARTSGDSRFVAGNFETVYPGLSLWATGNTLHNGVPVPTLAGANLTNKALVKALNRLKDQELHLGNFLAEGQQVVDLIGGTAHNIARQVTTFRRNNPKQIWELIKRYERGNLARDLWRCIPNSWLQLQYGWIPLMSDVEGAANELARHSLTRDPLCFTKGSAKSEEEVDCLLISRKSGNEGSATWVRKQKAIVNLVYGLNKPALVTMSQLGLINPAEIIWEVTRYSFVVDWFLPIGGWLSSLTGDVGYNFVTGGISRKTVASFKSSHVTKTSSDARSVNAPVFTGTIDNFARTCYTSAPVPGLYVKSPISLKHALNGLSLLVQAFK